MPTHQLSLDSPNSLNSGNTANFYLKSVQNMLHTVVQAIELLHTVVQAIELLHTVVQAIELLHTVVQAIELQKLQVVK